jgi:carbamoyl-phosphate synthase small subunit
LPAQLRNLEHRELIAAKPPAILALADGSIFRGEGIGAEGISAGEVVFNTAMTGYQDILTDPSYCRQIVTLTYPHIGNTGVNGDDAESGRVDVAGLVIRDLSMTVSNWRSGQSLADYLRVRRIVAIAGIDMRKLTRILREKGALGGCLMSAATAGQVDETEALRRARDFPGLAGMDLAKVVSTTQAYEWLEGQLGAGQGLWRPVFAALSCCGLRHWRQTQYPAHAGRSRLPRYGAAGADTGSRAAQAQARRGLLVQRPG